MNKYQEGLNKIKLDIGYNYGLYGIPNTITKDFSTLQELVDKATPKKPKNIYIGLLTDCDDEFNISYGKKGYCPCCNEGQTEWDRYCNKCGQALDWSEE